MYSRGSGNSIYAMDPMVIIEIPDSPESPVSETVNSHHSNQNVGLSGASQGQLDSPIPNLSIRTAWRGRPHKLCSAKRGCKQRRPLAWFHRLDSNNESMSCYTCRGKHGRIVDEDQLERYLNSIHSRVGEMFIGQSRGEIST